MTERTQSPDELAHTLVTNNGEPARFYVEDSTLTIPVEPYRSGTPETVDVPVSSFDAVIERADVEDGGLNVSGFGGIHLPASEWERVGLQKHWEADDVDLRSPLTDTHRKLELWASREHQFYDSDEDDWSYEHLAPLPDDSPLITEWNPHTDDDPENPPVPISYPTLTVYALHAEDADHDSRGCDRVEIGTVTGVEILDELTEWPEEPDIDKRELDISPPSRHPDIEYSTIDPLPVTDDVLTAVFTINRHAKQFSNQADHEYQMGTGAEARAYSLKKKALYKTKTVAVHRLVKQDESNVDITLHDLNGDTEMYCFYFDGYSFHQPKAAVEDELLESATDPESLEAETIDFDSSADTDEPDQSLANALHVLATHDVNANDYLDATRVEDYTWGHEIIVQFDSVTQQSSQP